MTTCTIIAAAVLASTTLLATPSAADALLPSISPGDQIDYISDHQTETFCTLGYVYTGADEHVYGVTAGHCQPDTPGYMRDQNGGANGTFVRTSVSPAHTGGPDYGLVDFGRHVLAVPFIGDTPVANADVAAPRPGETICHSGVSSGRHCGTVVRAYGDDQYLTAGMPPSIPGDSGGPVWYRDADGAARVIGIWLGEKNSDGDRYGRFAALVGGRVYRRLGTERIGQVDSAQGHPRVDRGPRNGPGDGTAGWAGQPQRRLCATATGVRFRAAHPGCRCRIAGFGRRPLGHSRSGSGSVAGSAPSRRRRARIAEVIDLVGASAYAHRPIGDCSGGEQQRLLIAQALVRGPRLLLLDEALDSLDVPSQAGVSALVCDVCRSQQVAVVMVAHDVNPIAPYLDRVMYLARGTAVVGTPEDVITSEALSDLYGITVEVLRDSIGRLTVVSRPS